MKRLQHLIFGAFVLFTTASCSKRELVMSPDGPTWKHRPAWALQVAFRQPLLGGEVATKSITERSVSAIDPRHGRVFVGASDGGFYAVRANGGSVLWRFQAAGGIHSEALYDDERDVVYFGADDEALYAVYARTGKLKWRYRTGAEVQRRPALVQKQDGKSVLLFCNASDTVMAVDPDNGNTLWKKGRTPAQGYEVAGHAGVAVDQDRVYVAFSTGRVMAFDVDTGQERWPDEVNLGSSTNAQGDDESKTFDVDTTPIVMGDRIFVAGVSTGVFALDAQSGREIWKRSEAEGVTALTLFREPSHEGADGQSVPAREMLIAASGMTGLWSMNPKTGDVIWRQKTPTGGSLTGPIQFGGALLVSSSSLGFFLVDAQKGFVMDGFEPGTGYSAAAAVYGARAYVLSNGGYLLGLELTSQRRSSSWRAFAPIAPARFAPP